MKTKSKEARILEKEERTLERARNILITRFLAAIVEDRVEVEQAAPILQLYHPSTM